MSTIDTDDHEDVSVVRALTGPIWNRQTWERDIPFNAFQKFRGMGARRTIAGLARRLKVSETMVFRWSQQNRWRERVAAYDSELDAVLQARHRKAVLSMNDQHVKISRNVLSKVVNRLMSIDFDALEPKDVIRWLEVAVRMERLARGADTQQRNAIPAPVKLPFA